MAAVDDAALRLAAFEARQAAEEAQSLEIAFELQLKEAMRVSAEASGEQAPAEVQHAIMGGGGDGFVQCLGEQVCEFENASMLHSDRQQAAETAAANKESVARNLNDAKLARMIQAMPDDEWEDAGDLVELPQGTQTPRGLSLCFSAFADEAGNGGMAALLVSPANDTLWRSSLRLEGVTPGQHRLLEAKLRSLLMGLEACASLGIRDVTALVDNDNVIRYIQGTYEPGDEGEVIAGLRQQVARASAAVGEVSLRAVSRNSNKHIESIARRISRRRAPGRSLRVGDCAGGGAAPPHPPPPPEPRHAGGAGAGDPRAPAGGDDAMERAAGKRKLEVVPEDEGFHWHASARYTGVAGPSGAAGAGPSSAGAGRPEPRITCPICLEDGKRRDEVLTVGTCGHAFCFGCMEQHVLQHVHQRKFPVRCPQHKCQATLSMGECEAMVLYGGGDKAEEAVSQLAKLQVESMIPEDQRFYCPYPTCSALSCLPGDDAAQAECLVCRRMCCVKCRVPWHTGRTCAEYRREPRQEDTSLLEVAKQRKWRRCGGEAAGVGCGAMIELETGCNHITCKCGYEFCYNCGAKWEEGRAACGCPLWDEARLYDERGRERARRQERRAVNPRYKTRLCRNWQRQGNCHYGLACIFAHGQVELDID